MGKNLPGKDDLFKKRKHENPALVNMKANMKMDLEESKIKQLSKKQDKFKAKAKVPTVFRTNSRRWLRFLRY